LFDPSEAAALLMPSFKREKKKPNQVTPGGWAIAFSFQCLESVAALCSVETGKQYHNDCANLLLPNFFTFIYIGS